MACEESGRVTSCLRRLGIEAYSCDILPTRGNPEWHIQRDVTELLKEPWDAILAFPPCTHIATSGASWFKEKRKDGRQQEGIDFFMKFVTYAESHPFCLMAIENPVGIMSSIYRKPDQIIQPYQFGEDASKKTCLWLFNLPLLKPTKYVPPSWYYEGKPRWSNQCKGGQDRQGQHKNRGRDRSVTYQGVADAMASQWFHAHRKTLAQDLEDQKT